jgi:quercetin dioxygenase-like cupin family protein
MEARVRRSTLGDRADYNATHVPPDEGKSFWLATDLHTFKVVGEDANGAFALEELTAYTQFAPPPHIHHREDETYYILEGEFEFLADGRAFTASPGSVVYMPRGRLHMHKNAGDTPARALVLVTPAGTERLVEEAGEQATDPSSVPPPPGQ